MYDETPNSWSSLGLGRVRKRKSGRFKTSTYASVHGFIIFTDNKTNTIAQLNRISTLSQLSLLCHYFYKKTKKIFVLFLHLFFLHHLLRFVSFMFPVFLSFFFWLFFWVPFDLGFVVCFVSPMSLGKLQSFFLFGLWEVVVLNIFLRSSFGFLGLSSGFLMLFLPLVNLVQFFIIDLLWAVKKLHKIEFVWRY